MKVREKKHVERYIMSRGILRQYRKAKLRLQSGDFQAVGFKKRQPKALGIWYFRITKKYRGYCFRRGDTIIVFDVDDHQ